MLKKQKPQMKRNLLRKRQGMKPFSPGMIPGIIAVSIFLLLAACNGRDQTASEAEDSNIVARWPSERAKCRPVPMPHVAVSGFLGNRIDLNLNSLLAGLKSPIPRGFEARAAGIDPPHETLRLAADSDLYKWLEGACYAFARTQDPELREEIARIAGLILEAQRPDGTIFGSGRKSKPFDLKVNHDLYIAGHFFEAAVAHHRATGKEDLLQAACRWADFLLEAYENGHPYYRETREHPEYELGFLRLGRETGRREYIDFAAALALELSTVGPEVADIRAGGGLHAVRVGYLLAGMADLYLETGRQDMAEYLPGLWKELVDTRMYITGAIGSHGEQIRKEPFDLPLERLDHDHRHLGETCACVSMILFSWRMHAITGQSEYFDVIERVLYNHFLGAFSPDNQANFYYNPIHVTGDITGKTDHGHAPLCTRCRLPEIHSTACCMPNSWRFFGALPEYVFSHDNAGIFVNLYTSATVNHTLENGNTVKLAVQTDYPHDGKVVLRYEGEESPDFKLRLRIPPWCRGARVETGGEESIINEGGDYFVIDKTWQPGETVKLTMPMAVRMIVPDPRIEAQAGRVAFARGPLVYCLEKPDADYPVEAARVVLSRNEVAAKAESEWQGDMFNGIHMLHIPGIVDDTPADLPMVPWYVRANRSNDSRWVVMLP